MRSKWARLALAVAVFAIATRADAQTTRPLVPRDTNLTHVLYLADGSTLVGKLISRDSTSIVFETNGGMLRVPASRVTQLREIQAAEVRGNEYWFPDANETRLFFAPTGRMLKVNEGYYSNTYLFLQNFAGGLSNHVTLAGGFSMVPTADFLADNVYYIAPKVGLYNTDKTNVAIGALGGLSPGSDDPYSDRGPQTFGILYGVATRGGPDGSITAGVGYRFNDGQVHRRPLFMAGGSVRASKRVSLVTENYAWWTRDYDYSCVTYPCSQARERLRPHVLYSYGLRFMGEKLSTDFALWKSNEMEVFPGIPYVAFAVKF